MYRSRCRAEVLDGTKLVAGRHQDSSVDALISLCAGEGKLSAKLENVFGLWNVVIGGLISDCTVDAHGRVARKATADPSTFGRDDTALVVCTVDSRVGSIGGVNVSWIDRVTCLIASTSMPRREPHAAGTHRAPACR